MLFSDFLAPWLSYKCGRYSSECANGQLCPGDTHSDSGGKCLCQAPWAGYDCGLKRGTLEKLKIPRTYLQTLKTIVYARFAVHFIQYKVSIGEYFAETRAYFVQLMSS